MVLEFVPGIISEIERPYFNMLYSVLQQRRLLLEPYLRSCKSLAPSKEFSSGHAHFKSQIDTVKQSILEYKKNPNTNRPLTILISAPPGAGKSFLIKELASINDQKVLELNMSAVLKLETFGTFFNRLLDQESFVVDKKTNERRVPVCFFDEIDSPQWNFFQLMLMPMSDGKFLHEGRAVPLPPAIFFFAMSTSMGQQNHPDSHSYDDWLRFIEKNANTWLTSDNTPFKTRDFLSRIDHWLKLPPLRHHFCDCKATRIPNTTHTCPTAVACVRIAREKLEEFAPQIQEKVKKAQERIADAAKSHELKELETSTKNISGAIEELSIAHLILLDLYAYLPHYVKEVDASLSEYPPLALAAAMSENTRAYKLFNGTLNSLMPQRNLVSRRLNEALLSACRSELSEEVTRAPELHVQNLGSYLNTVLPSTGQQSPSESIESTKQLARLCDVIVQFLNAAASIIEILESETQSLLPQRSDEPYLYWQEMESLRSLAYSIRNRMLPRESKEICEVDPRVLQYLAGCFADSKRDVEKVIFLSTPDSENRRFLWEHLPKSFLCYPDKTGTPWYDYCSRTQYSSNIELHPPD